MCRALLPHTGTSVCPVTVPSISISPDHSAVLNCALSAFFLNRDSFLHEIYNLPLDIIPTSLLKGFLDIVGRSAISTVNSSMATGAVPSCFIHTMGLPLVKIIQFSAVSDPSPYCWFCTLHYMCFWNSMNTHGNQYRFRSSLFGNNFSLTVGSDCTVLFPIDFSAAFNMVTSCHHNWLSWAWGCCKQHCPGLTHVITEGQSHSGNFSSVLSRISRGVPWGSVQNKSLFRFSLLHHWLILLKQFISLWTC